MKHLCSIVCSALLFTALATLALAQQRAMIVAQLSGFIQSSVDAHPRLEDKVVAQFLKTVKLTEKLTPNKVSELMALGAGSLTASALRDLATSSANLPEPAAPNARPVASAPKPPSTTLTEPDSEERAKLLEDMREYAMNYTQGLPDFICNQVTRREEDRTGTGEHFQQVDKLQEQLTYFEHQEKYKILAVNGQMVENKDRLKLGGAISSGEFGSMMYEIFEPTTQTEFEWAKFAKYDGVIYHVFNYHVSHDRSHYSIEDRAIGKTIIAAYHGVIYARKSDNVVMRITLECDDIPASFPVQEVKLDLWYGTQKLSGHEFILPVKWDSTSRDGKAMSRSSATFALYRKYEADTTITFASEDDDKDKKDDKKPPIKKQP
jgi:hypothetical protein